MMRSKMASHIVTVGTSILTNYRRATGAPVSEVPTPEKLLEWLRERPVVASAELAALIPYLEQGEVDEVYLVCTETVEGKLCYDAVRLYLQERGVRVAAKSIAGVDTSEPQEKFLGGLAALRDAVASYARNRRRMGGEVFINATGGYKPEVAVLILVASVLGCRVYYRHETMTEPVELPLLLPVNLGEAMLDLLRRLAKQPDRRLVGPNVLPSLEVLEEAERRGFVSLRMDDAGKPFEARLSTLGRFALAVYGDSE